MNVKNEEAVLIYLIVMDKLDISDRPIVLRAFTTTTFMEIKTQLVRFYSFVRDYQMLIFQFAEQLDMATLADAEYFSAKRLADGYLMYLYMMDDDEKSNREQTSEDVGGRVQDTYPSNFVERTYGAIQFKPKNPKNKVAQPPKRAIPPPNVGENLAHLKKTNDGKWGCPKCTLFNSPDAVKCNCCEWVRGSNVIMR